MRLFVGLSFTLGASCTFTVSTFNLSTFGGALGGMTVVAFVGLIEIGGRGSCATWRLTYLLKILSSLQRAASCVLPTFANDAAGAGLLSALLSVA